MLCLNLQIEFTNLNPLTLGSLQIKNRKRLVKACIYGTTLAKMAAVGAYTKNLPYTESGFNKKEGVFQKLEFKTNLQHP